MILSIMATGAVLMLGMIAGSLLGWPSLSDNLFILGCVALALWGIWS